MRRKLLNEIKKMNGSLLGIGIEEPSMLDEIQNNDNIIECYIISDNKKNSKRYKMHKKGRDKKVNIKKLSKYFRIKSVDNIICNYSLVKKYIRSFQGESVYINKGKLYIYGNIDDLASLKERYLRFSKDIKEIKMKNEFMLIINNEKVKTNIFKNTFYKIVDFFSDALEKLTDLLIN